MTVNANKAEKLAERAERIAALGHVIISVEDCADWLTQKGVREVAWEMVKEAIAIKNFFEPPEDGCKEEA